MASLAGSFGEVADAYERGRPRYEPHVIAAIGEAIGGRRVLDVGAGTGRLAAPLLQAGYDVVAVEPLDAMRAILAGHVGAERALAGRAEALPIGNASVDGAVCGDAWHWFDGGRAADELARVVRPGGGVVVCVTRPRWPGRADTPDWWLDLGAVHAALPKGDHPSFPGARVADVVERPRPPDGLVHHRAFEPVSARNELFVHHTNREQIVAHWASISLVATLPPGQREELLSELEGMLTRRRVTDVDIPYRAELWITRRRHDKALLGDH
jgi:SAM-dependent methyltransferase